MKKLIFTAVLIISLLTCTLFSFKEDLFLVSKNLDIFAALYKEININYVEETDPGALMQSGIDSMLSGLDPYTDYIPESEIEDYKLKYVSTQYGGIGASTVIIDKKLYVNELLEGDPAQQKGIKPGDQITKINGVPTFAKDREEISRLLRGPKGSAVKLELEREGVVIERELIRAEIERTNVSYSGMLDGHIGYIRLDKFLENAGQEVKTALNNINKQQPKGIILDLRNNGGGILQEAVKIVNLFVPENQLIVSQNGRNPAKNVRYRSVSKPVAPDLPLVVLINRNSASASEIVAGALQDLDRAVIIGERSYGKGLVQQTFNLPYNSLVKVTVAKYYTPSGRCIQALDYAHKDKNGSAMHYTDSVITAFKTKGGRTVYNGNGIYPDLAIATEELSQLSLTLLTNNLFFDYANHFMRTHQTIGETKAFRLSDTDYTAFVNSLKGKNYNYTTKTEKILSELDKDNSKDDQETIDLIRHRLKLAKDKDFYIHKKEICRLLEMQIVSRYGFERGRIEQSFQYDEEVKRSLALFGQPNELKAILAGDGAHKIIGKAEHLPQAQTN